MAFYNAVTWLSNVAMKILSGRQDSLSYLGDRNLDYLIRSNPNTGTDNQCKLMQVSVTANTAIKFVYVYYTVHRYLDIFHSTVYTQRKAATRKHSKNANLYKGCYMHDALMFNAQ